jgi:hypothetical protein
MRLLSLFVLALSACGGGAAGTGAPGCDSVGNEYGFTQVHSCTEAPAGLGQAVITQLQTNCTSAGGSWVAQCSHAASGSCQFTPSNPAVLLTEWYLSSNAQDAMTICSGKGGTFKAQ